MNKIVLAGILFLVSLTAFAQPADTLSDKPSVPLKYIQVLPDHGYTLDHILADRVPPFTGNDSLRLATSTTYWLRLFVHNPFPQAKAITIRMQPALHNTLYYFDANNTTRWATDEGGLQAVTHTGRVGREAINGILRAGETNTMYIKVDISSLHDTSGVFMPQVILEKATSHNKQEQLVWISWTTCLVALFLFMLNNVYICYSFRNKSMLYFLLAQFGGMLYVTACKKVFPALIPCPVLTTGWSANGQPVWYDLNDLFIHLSIQVIMYGLVQFCRSYLNTQQRMTWLDTLLTYGLKGYLIINSLFILLNATLFYTESAAWLFENIAIGLLFALMIWAGVLAYKQKQAAAGPFLVANVVSFFLMLASVYHIWAPTDTIGYPLVKLLLPDLFIIALTAGYSMAFVARTRAQVTAESRP